MNEGLTHGQILSADGQGLTIIGRASETIALASKKTTAMHYKLSCYEWDTKLGLWRKLNSFPSTTLHLDFIERLPPVAELKTRLRNRRAISDEQHIEITRLHRENLDYLVVIKGLMDDLGTFVAGPRPGLTRKSSSGGALEHWYCRHCNGWQVDLGQDLTEFRHLDDCLIERARKALDSAGQTMHDYQPQEEVTE